MAAEHVVEFDFGQVKLQRNKRSKYLRLKVHPEKGVVVCMPWNLSEKDAIDFVIRKQDWIKKSLAKTQKITNRYTHFGSETNFRTRYHTLSLQEHKKQTLKYDSKGGLLKVFYPEGVDVKNERVQAFIRHALIEAMRYEAKKYLPKRTQELADAHGLRIGKISVRNNKSRWGSCSGKNNISLNIQLMRLPDELCDYVIYHELAHVKVKQHGKPFWDYLETLLPGAKKLDKQLNQYHLTYW